MFRVPVRAWCVAAIVALAGRGLAAATPEFVWVEGEAPASVSPEGYEPKVGGWGHKEFLSNEKWLQVDVDAKDVASKVPEAGIVLSYAMKVGKEAKYEVWNRIGYEFARSRFDWRVDGGEWHSVAPDALTTDLMEMDFFCEVAWLKMGEVPLTAGAHQLEIRVPKVKDAKGNYSRILYASDALCLYEGAFVPHEGFKPNESGRTPRDEEAAKTVFKLPEPGAGGVRSSVAINGLWEVCRHDENMPGEVAAPIVDFPVQPYWSAIEVPGNKNTQRPDLEMAHRLWYRTRINVPASCAGRSFYLTFPENSLNTTVTVNGQLCGFSKNPFVVCDIDVSKAIKPGVNEICVGIKDAWYGRSANPEDPMKLRRTFNTPVRFFGQGFQDLSYTVWNHAQSGILQTPVFTAAGAVYAADVFVKPSVAKKELAAEVTVLNPTGQEVRGDILCAAVDAKTGVVATTLEAQPFTVAAGGTGVITVAGAWADAKLWWPDSPVLYTLRTTVRVAGAAVDVKETTFGFREWTIDGIHFKLNGIVFHGWCDNHNAATREAWLESYRAKGEQMIRFWGEGWMGLPAREALDFFDRSGVVVRRSGILDGESIGYMAIENDKALKAKYHSEIKMDLMNNWRDQEVAQVKAERNHPSVMIWSTENEYLFINCINLYGNLMDKFEAEVTKTSRAVNEADPTRPTMVDGGGACKDQSLPVHGNHYITGAWTEYPELAYEDNVKGGGRGRWIWDKQRPRFVGEDLFIAGNHPDFSTFGGEAAFTGKAGSLPAAGLLISMAQQGYRWADYAGWDFWMSQSDADGSEYKYFAPRVALVREWDWTFGAGDTVKRTVGLFNDTRFADPITWSWTLTVGDKVVASESKAYTVPPGERQIVPVSFTLPNVETRQEGTWLLTLAVGGKEVWRDTKAVSVLNTYLPQKAAGVAGLNAGNLLVYDPNHSLGDFLTSRKIQATVLSDLKTLPDDGKVLLIGKDALDAAESTSSHLAAWAAPGRSVIVLEQKNPLKYQALPCDMDAAVNEGRVGFGEDLEHPVLHGLLQKDFFAWGGSGGSEEIVYRNAYEKPSRGAKSLLQCDMSLHATALVEVPADKGLLLLSQLVIGEKLAGNAVAQQLLTNMLGYAATYKQVFRPAMVVAADSPTLGKVIDAMGVQAMKVGDPLEAMAHQNSIAIVSATPAHLKSLASHLSEVRKFTSSGGWIVLAGLTPEGLADFNTLVGVEHLIRPFGSARPTLTKDGPMAIERVLLAAPRNHLTAGLSASDVSLYSGKRIFPWMDGNYALPNEFTYVVDIDDVAPFATSEFAHLGNITNGFVNADGWPLILNAPIPKDGSTFEIPLTLPAPQTLTEFTWVGNTNYCPSTHITLIFDGDRDHPMGFDVQPIGDPQVLAITPPRAARQVTIQLDKFAEVPGKDRLLGIDNVSLKAQRSADFYQKVRPMLNIGAMVEYPQGPGGMVLCNVNFAAQEDVPLNAVRKQQMLAVVLRNLKAPFAGGRTVIAGGNLVYTPIDLSKQANQYRNERGWFGDKNFTFADLPVGSQKLGGVSWNIYDFPTSPVPTAIMLAGDRVPNTTAKEVSGIPVGCKADALFFLQTARMGQRHTAELKKGVKHEMFHYVIHYADGSNVTVPVYAEINIDDAKQQGQPAALPGAQIAWTAKYAGTEMVAVAYSMQWNNPHPEVEIVSVDMAYGDPKSGTPVLLALTAASAK